MPFSMKKLLTRATGKDPEPGPVFDPPNADALCENPSRNARIGLFVSCGAQLPEDPALGETEDISFRLFIAISPLSRSGHFPQDRGTQMGTKTT